MLLLFIYKKDTALGQVICTICDRNTHSLWRVSISTVTVGTGQAGWHPLGPAGALACPCQYWHWGSNRRSDNHLLVAPQEAEHEDLGWLLPLRQAGRWQLGRARACVFLNVCVSYRDRVRDREKESEMICESSIHLWKWPGCQSASACLRTNSNLQSGVQIFPEKWEKETEQLREHYHKAPCIPSLSLFLNLCYEYHLMLSSKLPVWLT